MQYCQGFNQFGELCLFAGEYDGYCGMHDPNNDFQTRAAWAKQYFEFESFRKVEFVKLLQQKEREYTGPKEDLYNYRRKYIEEILKLDVELDRCLEKISFLESFNDEYGLADIFSDLTL